MRIGQVIRIDISFSETPCTSLMISKFLKHPIYWLEYILIYLTKNFTIQNLASKNHSQTEIFSYLLHPMMFSTPASNKYAYLLDN